MTPDQPVQRDLVALHGHVLELRGLRIVADMHLHLVGPNGILHLAQILAQIAVGHLPDNQGGAIVVVVHRVLEGVLVGELQGLAVLDEVAPANGFRSIVAVQLGGGALLGVHIMPMGGHDGAVLDIDVNGAMGRMATAIVSQALVVAGVLLINIVEDNHAILVVHGGGLSVQILQDKDRVGKWEADASDRNWVIVRGYD